MLEDSSLNVSSSVCLSGRKFPVLYILLADDVFPLRPHIMKSFPGTDKRSKERIYNYRYCRDQRLVENAFGVVSVDFTQRLKETSTTRA
ncbi:hypothetical protein AVEN_201734-1 [Araneus ventricosus]|uniref:DDE Tnp4 domain-containing protein n=1 Tax=Araneus ventricosus TaxID=182803 RepID=A0A4Y2WA70_ARAVE|nr:hypothetical protein AVEN_201734-1 [Araneus ventricosus]